MDNDFSPATQDFIASLSAVLLLGVVLLALFGLQHPAPWSPLGKASANVTSTAVAPGPSRDLFNPHARLDNSRMNNN